MKFKRHTIAAIVISIVLIVGSITTFTVILFNEVTRSTEENQYFLLEAIVKSRLKSSEDRVQQLGEIYASMPRVRTLFAEGKRIELYDELSSLYKVQADKYGIADSHFAIPPATSFLRMRDVKKFGDDLSYKPQVLEVNNQNVIKKGETLSRSGPVFYAAVPISDTTGKLVGCVQVDLKFEPVLDKLKATYNIELSLLIKEKDLKETATAMGGDVINDNNRVGAYIKCHSTNWDLMKSLITDKDVASFDGVVEPFVREYAKTSYGMLLHPLKDYNGSLFGYIVIASDFSASRSQAGKTTLMFITLSVFAVVLLIGVVIIFLRGGLIKPLNMLVSHYKELAEGNKELTIGDTSKYYSEIKDLAEYYETLRTKDEVQKVS